jgi:hypothetical protein
MFWPGAPGGVFGKDDSDDVAPSPAQAVKLTASTSAAINFVIILILLM